MALINAVINRRVDLVAELLENPDIDVCEVDEHGYTALMQACGAARNEQDYDIVKLLLTKGDSTQITKQNRYGTTALIMAAMYRNRDIVQLLLDTGCTEQSNKQNEWEETALFAACRYNYPDNREVVELLLNNSNSSNPLCKEYVDKPDKTGCTPLIMAAFKGHVETVRLLLAAGADVTRQDEHGNTALILASCNDSQNHTEIVRLLLDTDNPLLQIEHINKRDKLGNTALMLASRCDNHSNKEVVELLLDAADLVGQSDYVKQQNYSGNTVLIHACSIRYANKEVVELLLNRVDPLCHDEYVNHANNSGYTALMVAAKKEMCTHKEIIELLLLHGAFIDQQNDEGKTAIDLACSDCHDPDGVRREEMRELLLNYRVEGAKRGKPSTG